MGANAELLKVMGPELELLLPRLDERSRRLVLGMAARAAGDGGTGAVAAVTGASWQTVADGKAELESGEDPPPGRVRRPGGGRKRLAEADPGLVPALEALIRDAMRGDPESPLIWTTRSVQHLADELAAAGHRCSPATAWRTLRRAGYTMQSNSKAAEGRQHPERDAQFRYIAAQAREHQEAGQPVISVDSKKREQAGNYGQDGAEWGPKGEPAVVRSHDFPDRDGRHAVPYGVLGRGRERRVRERRHRREHRRPGRGVGPPLVAARGQGRLPGRDAAAGHLRRRRIQRGRQPGLEDRHGRA